MPQNKYNSSGLNHDKSIYIYESCYMYIALEKVVEMERKNVVEIRPMVVLVTTGYEIDFSNSLIIHQLS